MNKQSISEAKEKVQQGLSSIYSKDDVIELLNSIQEQTPSPTGSNGILKSSLVVLLNEAIKHLDKQISLADLDNGNEYFDLYSARYELSGNEISVESIDANWNEIKSEIEYFIDENKDNMIEHLIENCLPTSFVVIDDMKEEEQEQEEIVDAA
jgi:hypothetical protein